MTRERKSERERKRERVSDYVCVRAYVGVCVCLERERSPPPLIQIGGKASTCERGACDNKVRKQLSGQKNEK